MRRWIVVCFLALTTGLVSVQAKSTLDPRAVTIRLSDLPAGFTNDKSLYNSPEAVAKADKSKLRATLATGLVSEYVVLDRSPRTSGFAGIVATTYLFTSPRAAAADYAVGKKSPQPSYMRPISLARVGQAIFAAKGTTPDLGYLYFAVFLSGPYEVNMLVFGPHNTFSSEVLVHYARIIDARIRAQLK